MVTKYLCRRAPSKEQQILTKKSIAFELESDENKKKKLKEEIEVLSKKIKDKWKKFSEEGRYFDDEGGELTGSNKCDVCKVRKAKYIRKNDPALIKQIEYDSYIILCETCLKKGKYKLIK